MASTPAPWPRPSGWEPSISRPGTRIRFSQGRLSEIETIRGSAPLAVSGLDIPPGTTIALCDGSPDIDYLLVPEDSAVTVAGVKLTGRMNFDCGKFQYGSLFEDTVLGGRSLPRHASISREDIFGGPAPRASALRSTYLTARSRHQVTAAGR